MDRNNVAATNLLDLNDACLAAIVRYLQVDDLASIASTCTQLKAIACIAFDSKASNKLFDFNQMQCRLAGFDYDPQVEVRAKRMLQNFGHLLHEINLDVNVISIDNYHNMIPIMEHVITYCSGGALQKLRFSQVELTTDWIARGANLFRNLKTLGRMYYDDEEKSEFFGRVLPVCKNLETLSLYNCLLKTDCFDNDYPNLTSVSLSCHDSGPTLTRAIEQFLLRHRRTIDCLRFYEIPDFNLAILEKLTALEDVHVHLTHPKWVPIVPAADQLPLQRLQFLTIECKDEVISRFLNKLANSPTVASSLTQCFVVGLMDDLYIDSLNKFQKLATLRLQDNVTSVLQQLNGPIETLERLCIDLIDTTIDDALILALSRFRKLSTLIVTVQNCQVRDCDFNALKHLDKITEFNYSGDIDVMNWLSQLGSTQTLKCIDVAYNASIDVSVDCLKNLHRFEHLQTMTICRNDFNDDNLIASDGFRELCELRMYIGRMDRPENLSTWRGILAFIKRSPKLQKFQVNHLYDQLPLTLEVYNDLVEVYRTRGTQLVIEYVACNGTDIPVAIAAVYGDCQRFVKVDCLSMC